MRYLLALLFLFPSCTAMRNLTDATDKVRDALTRVDEVVRDARSKYDTLIRVTTPALEKVQGAAEKLAAKAGELGKDQDGDGDWDLNDLLILLGFGGGGIGLMARNAKSDRRKTEAEKQLAELSGKVEAITARPAKP